MTTYRVPDGVGWVDLEDGVLAAVFGLAEQIRLSSTAYEIWVVVAAGCSVEATTAQLSSRYARPPADLADVVGTTVTELVAAGLLEAVHPGGRSDR